MLGMIILRSSMKELSFPKIWNLQQKMTGKLENLKENSVYKKKKDELNKLRNPFLNGVYK